MKTREGMEQRYADYLALNGKDGYSKTTVLYGDKWATTMEKVMEVLKVDQEGGISMKEFFDQHAERISHECATQGITGFMYVAAIAGLSKFWVHGDALRVWHNAKYDVGPEVQGTVNPAVFVIGEGPVGSKI